MIWILVAVVAVALLWIRFAPYDPTRWHVAPSDESVDRDFPNAVIRVVKTGPDGLARLDQVARATARTEAVSGEVEKGMVTYVTRSRIFGFPDYTTAQQSGNALRIHARSRFGRSDFGVNRKRVARWLEQIEP